MQNGQPTDVTRSLDGLLTRPDGSLSPNSLQGTAPVEQSSRLTQPEQPTAYVALPKRHRLISGLRLALASVAIIFLLIGGAIVFIQRANRVSRVQTGIFGAVHVPLDGLRTVESTNEQTQSLKVNGRLEVTNSIVLTPTSQPTNPLTGQLYYDKTANRLTYYDGQQFISVVGQTSTGGLAGISGGSTTNITNIIGGTSAPGGPPSVELQSSTPGIQQTGNFNISGAGSVGTLKTSVIDSSGASLFFNPTAVSAPSQPGGVAATVGLTAIGSTSTALIGPIKDTIIATKALMGDTGGTLKSITVYLEGGSAAKHIQVAIYDDDGDVPSRPASLLAFSSSTTLVPNTFNTIQMPSIALTANATYWLAFNTDDATVARRFNGGNKTSCFYGLTFGFMPDPFAPAPCFFSNEQYTIYGNFITSSGSSSGFSKAQMILSDTGQVTFQNTQDSSTAFQVQNALGTATVFNIDTANSRVAIGKATAAYRLDIAAGDINLSNGRSVRFNGLQALTMNAAGTTTSVSNFQSGGNVAAQADNFIVQDANGSHQNLVIDSSGGATFSNRVNSTTAFRIQNATGTPLLRADSSGMQLFVGNPSGDASPVVLYLANKNTSGDPAGAEGGTYYNSTLGSFRCFYSGFWHTCADIEPQHGFSLYDEFMGGQTALTGQIGSLGWSPVAIGANGSLTLNPTTPTPVANRPGVLDIQTPAVANQGTTLLLGDSTGGSMLIAKDNDVKAAVAIGAATGQVARIGLHNETSTTAQPLSGVWWEANPGANANWRYCYGDGVAATCANTSVAIAANTWVTLEARVTATGNGTSVATFVINGNAFTVSGGTIDISTRVSPSLTCFGTTGAVQHCYWDYFQLTGTTTALR